MLDLCKKILNRSSKIHPLSTRLQPIRIVEISQRTFIPYEFAISLLRLLYYQVFKMLGSFLTIAAMVALVHGHGRVLDPPGRGSAWRSGYSSLANYDDDGLNCGGFFHQWGVNDGKCGICGDPWDTPEPRDHELGGKYGLGVITGRYTMGSVINVVVQLTAYHQGYWMLKICPDANRNDQECFEQYVLELEDGGTQYYPKRSATYELAYRLPAGLTCDHCVLQWRYIAGNNWGDCRNGTQGLGCGNQEYFGACSDISIEGSNAQYIPVDNAANEIPSPLLHYLSNGYFNVQQGLMHLVWKGEGGSKQIQSTNKPDLRKKKHKERLKQQSKKKRKTVKRTKPNQVTHWRANSIGPNTKSEYYKHNLDPKLPMPSYYF
ncbi:hypothetical protein K1T71_009568 [Dendrolimus kikuchii]|uniref:Uncharacterized protein n=1 Tax=Dendrolimus kikuchii TaxID=765133 RepID=A0ACC1CSG0_9NEOP|nr:hypothetical protein K1T71_009568 [Dendrolimus kikuchii]